MDSSSNSTIWNRIHGGHHAAGPNRSPGAPPPPLPPLHTKAMNVNLQSASPLYNGTIPPEIRHRIFIYAMTEFIQTDPSATDAKGPNSPPPGYTGPRAVTISLLLACRRTYLETYHLPPRQKEHVFFHVHFPPLLRHLQSRQEDAYFCSMTPWQLALVKEVHLFTQQSWLEDGSFSNLCMQFFMQGIAKLKITIRRSDWWWNMGNTPLGINPKDIDADPKKMKQDWEAEKRGVVLPFRTNAWGCAFGYLKALEELEMEFETTGEKVGELAAIVAWARTWRFPLGAKRVLSTRGVEQGREWQGRGPMGVGSEDCPFCYGLIKCRDARVQIVNCREKQKLRALGFGPECTVFSVRWRVAEVEELA